MDEVFLKVIETAAPPNGVWTSELWSGAPGSAGATRLAGGPLYTQAQLEAPTPQGTTLDHATVLDKLRTEEQDDEIFPEIGARLYRLLQETGTAAAWQARRAQAEKAAGPLPGLRTYIEVEGTLAEWPWELLAWPKPGVPGNATRAFESTRHPMVRMTRLGNADQTWTGTTVRILLVSGQEKLDASDVASTELRLIRRAFHTAGLSVIVDLCEAPREKRDLEDRITRFCPHILHFIGHGDLDAAGREFVLRFNKPTQAQTFDWEWSTNEIGTFFTDSSWKPRLVVLNSCHSSRRERHAAPVALALLAAGVPAVIGAQAALQIDYAREFSRAFYEALAQQQPLDQAMTTARRTLSGLARYQGYRKRHWALPVLTVQVPPPEVLRFARTDAAIIKCEVAQEAYTRPGRFVNRASDRWSILSALCPADATKPAFRGVILHGDAASVGKSWLVKRSLRDFVDARFMVRYATLVGREQGRTSLDVLAEWRGLDTFKSPILAPVPGPHFDEFDQALAAARAGARGGVEEAFRTFRKGLQSARRGARVLLVLGRFRETGFSWVQSLDFQNNLLEKLLLPIRALNPDPEVDGVYALLITRTHNDPASGGQTDDVDEFSLDRLSDPLLNELARSPEDGFRRCKVGLFAREEFDNHFDEFIDFANNDGIDGLRAAVRFAVAKNPTWSPSRLAKPDDMLRDILSGSEN
ncbi:MAG: CHAT domain-containing protein [Vicinamibacterales bacterium]